MNTSVQAYLDLGYEVHSTSGKKTFLINNQRKITTGVIVEVGKETKVLNAGQIEALLDNTLHHNEEDIPMATKTKKAGVKPRIRKLMASGKNFSIEALANKLGATETAVRTAISDLRSEKYCGEGGPLDIKKTVSKNKTVFGIAPCSQ